MKIVSTSLVVAILCIGLVSSGGSLATALNYPLGDTDALVSQSLGGLNHFALKDSVPPSHENYGYTEPPKQQPLEIHASDDSRFDYMAVSLYYKVFFKGTRAKMVMNDAWIEFELTGHQFGEKRNTEALADKNSLSVCDVFDAVDLIYKVDTSLFTEAFTLRESREFKSISQEISWGGIIPEFQEDGSILFVNEKGKEVLRILPPFMEDAENNVSRDLHYELRKTETGYELHKVIDEKGLEWLKEAIYPVIIDPSVETLEDAWESSGLQPYGQYFQNLKEYVNPANGHLTITQTDLVIPGRGLDLILSRVYEMPAVFYGSDPYDYEAPPTDVGKGWLLDFPYVGSKYVHLWGGTIFKIVWVGDQFVNVRGKNFILVKNQDDTYTLTTASGIVYEFNTSGKLTQIKDVDQNTISFTYTDGDLTSITDTIGRTVSLTYSNDRLWKITYNSSEIEYSYDGNGCLQWMDDFLNRRTEYEYNSGYNNWLLSKIEYPTDGYTTYAYNRFTDSDYYKYYITDQRVYETSQVRHTAFSYTGDFDGITSSTTTIKNESDVTQGSYEITITDKVISQIVFKNSSGTPIRKFTLTYDSSYDTTQIGVYNDGSTLSYTAYYSYDDWGNLIYFKDAEGHEQFFSYANTNTSGFFIDNSGTIIKTFTNAFSSCTVSSSVHDALLGMAEKQDATFVKEMYVTYDSEAHPTQYKDSFGNTTTWLTFSGTFNEKTSSTSFPIDLTGHTVTGNGVLQITGIPSDDIYLETKSFKCSNCPFTCYDGCQSTAGSWSNAYYNLDYKCWVMDMQYIEQDTSIGPFTHKSGTLGYYSYFVTPAIGQYFTEFYVKTQWYAYPAQVQYKMNSESYTTLSSNLLNTTVTDAATGFINNSSNTLYFTESSAQSTKFSWYLYVPVDNSPDTYTTSMTYDTYGNMTSITDAESNSVTYTYSSTYSYAYPTEVSYTVDSNTITTKATYDSNRGWMTSLQQPKGVAGSGYDYLYTYDVLGRITKKEFPLLSGQGQRSYLESVYDCENRTTTIIDQLGHYIVHQYDKLGRQTSTKWYTGTYGSGTLYATQSYTYRYDDLLATTTDPGNHTTTYTYDFLGRQTQTTYPGSISVSYSYDDTNYKITFTDGRSYETIFWYDWLDQLTKVEDEYTTDTFATTTYQYDELGHLTSVTDAENHATTYIYASFFGLTKTTYPDSEYEEYEYNDVGNITSFTDCKGNETLYTYDDMYRLTEIEYPDQSTISFTYDLNSNRTEMEDDAPNTDDYVEYAYDCWNRLTTETRHISQSTYAVSYQYDVASRLTKLTYPDSMQILYTYDDLNRMTEVKRYVDGSNDEILMDNTQYSTDNLLTQFDNGNDLQATFTYDSRDRSSTIDIKNGETSLLDLDYTYDNSNNITQLVNGWRDTGSTWHSETESYGYDGLDRLTSASCTSWSHTYSYDKVGNRASKDSVTYTCNTVNEVTALSDGTSFTYDDNGNRTQKTKGNDTWDYTYDYANRLTKFEENSSTVGEYVYDGDGKRLQVTEDSVTTTYIYAGMNILYEENTSGTATYIHGPKGMLAKRVTVNQETSTFYYHTDHLGTTRLVTDSSKSIVAAVTYKPFGEPYVEEGSEHYLFTGKEEDETGLYYYNARFYDCEIGRFVTRDFYTFLPDDPRVIGNTEETCAQWLRDPQGLNRYTYVGNNPLRFSDPTGLWRWCPDDECRELWAELQDARREREDDEGDSSEGGDPKDLKEKTTRGIVTPDDCPCMYSECSQTWRGYKRQLWWFMFGSFMVSLSQCTMPVVCDLLNDKLIDSFGDIFDAIDNILTYVCRCPCAGDVPLYF